MEANFIGIIPKKIKDKYNLKSDMVYIGDQNKEHIKKKHFQDYERFYKEISNIINNPDYFGKNPKDNSIELIKIIKTDDDNFVKVAVRISKNQKLYARTLYSLNSDRFYWNVKKGYYLKIDEI